MRKLKKEITNDPVLHRIMDLLKQNGNTEKELNQYLGLTNSAFHHWKFDGSRSFMEYIDKIAEFTGTSIDFLVRGGTVDGFEGKEEEIMRMYRMLNKHRQEIVFELLQELKRLTEIEESDVDELSQKTHF